MVMALISGIWFAVSKTDAGTLLATSGGHGSGRINAEQPEKKLLLTETTNQNQVSIVGENVNSLLKAGDRNGERVQNRGFSLEKLISGAGKNISKITFVLLVVSTGMILIKKIIRKTKNQPEMV